VSCRRCQRCQQVVLLLRASLGVDGCECGWGERKKMVVEDDGGKRADAFQGAHCQRCQAIGYRELSKKRTADQRSLTSPAEADEEDVENKCGWVGGRGRRERGRDRRYKIWRTMSAAAPGSIGKRNAGQQAHQGYEKMQTARRS
jgi:hypothetical protein